MDKAIYKIRGNVFFKLGIYILVAVLAYGTLYTGGLVLQGSYLGVYSDDDQGATPYERLVNDYVEDTNYALTEKVNLTSRIQGRSWKALQHIVSS